jgi:DNA-directed RNA polymerase subunit RPC12/RpoP
MNEATPAPARHPAVVPGRCAGCGAELALDPERHVTRCGHCGAANLVRGRVVVPVARLRPVLAAAELPAALARFARAADLGRVPAVVSSQELWLPYWVTAPAAAGRPARAAAGTDDPQLAERPLPAAEVEPLDEAVGGWTWPDSAPATGEVLRYLPWFRVRLAVGARELDGWVDRVSGEVLTAESLNPERLRFSPALGWLLGAFAGGVVALAAFVPNPWVALAASVGWSLLAWYPAHRLAAGDRHRPAGAGEGAGG